MIPYKRLRRASALFAALSALLLSGCAPSAASDSTLPTLTVGSDTYPPYVYMDNNGDITGLDVEIAEEAFRRMGYRAEFTTIDWEKKTELVDSGEIDCIWGCFSMSGREHDYQWAGPYAISRQVIAVDAGSDIYTMGDLAVAVGAQSGIETMSELAGKTIAVQATGKPEAIFLRGGDNVPAFRDIISLADRGVQYAMLDCGYVDAVAAHEEAIRQYMKDYGANFRILDEPLLVTGIGVAFSRHDTRGLAAQLDEVFEQMREDGSMEKLAGKYLDDPTHSLEVDALEQ